MAPAPDPRLDLARRIFERTGSRQQVVDGLTSRGYAAGEVGPVVDQVAGPAVSESPTSTRAASTSEQTGPPEDTPRRTPPPRSRAGKSGRGGSAPSPGRAGRGRSGMSPSLSLPRRPSAGDMGGFAFGLFLFALGSAYIRYGAAGPKGWLGAKFLNRPLVPDELDPAADTTPDDGDWSTRPAAPTPI